MGMVGLGTWSADEVARLFGASHVVLSLQEVREMRRAALFFDFGDALLYLDDALFDIRSRETGTLDGIRPLPLPHQVLEAGVGIEHGWRHVTGCDCECCAAARRVARPEAKRAA
jgi:hypothetical protein